MLSGRILQSAWRVIILGCYVIFGKTIKQWSEETGLPVKLIRLRLRDYYDKDKILAPKQKVQVPRGSIKGFVVDCAQKQGVSTKAIYMRLYRGWTKEEVIAGVREKL